jgi:hypothetical protein
MTTSAISVNNDKDDDNKISTFLISRGNRLLLPPLRKNLRDFILLEARAPGRT